MIIRESADTDKQAIYDIHRNAFDESEAEAVAKLAIDLLEDETAAPLLSLLAQIDDLIVGHILFTRVYLEKMDIEGGYILAPLAVLPGHQRRGIGKALIRQGLELLSKRNAAFVLVLGDPNYYKQSGFETCRKLSPPYPLAYPQAWMAQELRPGLLDALEDQIRCADSLQAEEYW